MIKKKLVEQNFKVLIELLIPNRPENKRPDIVAYDKENHRVLVTVI